MDVTEQTFDTDVVERSREQPVVVDFWADWCQPCHMLAPVLEQAVSDRDGQVVLAKVDIDANPGLADRFSVRGIPAVKAFRNGKVVNEFVGVQPPAAVEAFLDTLSGPTELERVLEELRETGEEPELVAAVEAGDHEAALERVLEEIPGADADRRERLRRLAVAIFDELGQEHPLSMRYRRRLAATLY